MIEKLTVKELKTLLEPCKEDDIVFMAYEDDGIETVTENIVGVKIRENQVYLISEENLDL